MLACFSSTPWALKRSHNPDSRQRMIDERCQYLYELNVPLRARVHEPPRDWSNTGDLPNLYPFFAEDSVLMMLLRQSETGSDAPVGQESLQ